MSFLHAEHSKREKPKEIFPYQTKGPFASRVLEICQSEEGMVVNDSLEERIDVTFLVK